VKYTDQSSEGKNCKGLESTIKGIKRGLKLRLHKRVELTGCGKKTSTPPDQPSLEVSRRKRRGREGLGFDGELNGTLNLTRGRPGGDGDFRRSQQAWFPGSGGEKLDKIRECADRLEDRLSLSLHRERPLDDESSKTGGTEEI